MTTSPHLRIVNPRVLLKPSLTGLQGFVDGSCYRGKASFAWALVVNNDLVAHNCGLISSNEAKSSWNVAAEIRAVTDLVEFLVERSLTRVEIFYDYLGLEKWAKGEWKAKKPITQEYQEAIKKSRKHLAIEWYKVKSHSGNRWNDFVDNLAGSLVHE